MEDIDYDLEVHPHKARHVVYYSAKEGELLTLTWEEGNASFTFKHENEQSLVSVPMTARENPYVVNALMINFLESWVDRFDSNDDD